MKDIPDKDKRLLREIRLTNLLSFGPETEALPLESLNVLIGPNGSGKSNLIEALALMRATPVLPQATSSADVRGVLRRSGGAAEWIWKGAKGKSASVEVVVNNPKGSQPLRHVFAFRSDEQGFVLHDERVENEKAYSGQSEPYFYPTGRPRQRLGGQPCSAKGKKAGAGDGEPGGVDSRPAA